MLITLEPICGHPMTADIPPDGLDDAERAALARQYASGAPAPYPRAFAAACAATAPLAQRAVR